MKKRFSKAFWYCVDVENRTRIATGSPADIRKVIKDIEAEGMYNIHAQKPIMREGRLYSIEWPEVPSVGNGTYSVGDSYVPYIYRREEYEDAKRL